MNLLAITILALGLAPVAKAEGNGHAAPSDVRAGTRARDVAPAGSPSRFVAMAAIHPVTGGRDETMVLMLPAGGVAALQKDARVRGQFYLDRDRFDEAKRFTDYHFTVRKVEKDPKGATIVTLGQAERGHKAWAEAKLTIRNGTITRMVLDGKGGEVVMPARVGTKKKHETNFDD